MDPALAAFLDTLPPAFQEGVIWGGGQTPLRVTTFLTQQLPPIDYVSSVRAIVFNKANTNEVIACDNKDGWTHIVPGGRREQGETLEETLRREVLEETGWHVTGITPVGIWHFHHLAPRLAHYRFPYPDFLNVIYRAKTTRYDAAARIADDYETGSHFIGLETLPAIRLEQPSQAVLARHAAVVD